MSDFGPLMVFLESISLSEGERRMLADPRVGGVILFNRNYATKEQLQHLTTEIKSIAANLIIAIDHEGGRVQRLKDEYFTHLPAARLFGHYYDKSPQDACDLIRATGALVAYELNQVQIDLSLSPVLDLDTGISSVIKDRALHSDPTIVSLLGAEFIRGLHDGGMLGVGKHYPGHGSVGGDTHTHQVSDERQFEDIYNNDMLPYRQLIDDDLLDAVMMAHIIYPEIDDKPASLSAKWMTESLENIGFQGIVLSDDINMKGVAEKDLSTPDLLASGCHIILVCDNKDLLKKTLGELDAKTIENCQNRLKQRWLARKKAISEMEQRQYDFTLTKADLLKLQ